MPSKVPNDVRDDMMTKFREKVCERLDITPFEHQRRWWAATDGFDLLGPDAAGPKVKVRLSDDTLAERTLAPRPKGRARVVAELAAYKAGKSFGAALWATGLAAVPGSKTYLVGIEYDMCAPEFEYLVEFLLSDRGLKLPYTELQDHQKEGRLWMQLENGARFEARSWARAESLKGKEVDAYIFCEAYQLPGIESYMSIKQNLRARQGYTVFPTTPDSPWIQTLHENGHDNPDYPDWQCFCSIPASVNPYTYDAAVEKLDSRLMTKEKYNIAYLGNIGTYVGRVFAYQRGGMQFTTQSHPELWYDRAGGSVPANFRIPSNWTIALGVDTGTFMGAVIAGFDDVGNMFVLDELPNYRYLGSQTIELDASLSLTGWANELKRRCAMWAGKPIGWCDMNSQFKDTFWRDHGITLIGNKVGREAATESLRQFFQHNKIWLAPWLQWLPYEIEHASWPETATASGKFDRVKENDHLLDGLEHLASRRIHGTSPAQIQIEDPHIWRRPAKQRNTNPHMGRE